MASSRHSLSGIHANNIPNAEPYRFGIVVAEWNREITDALLNGTYDALLEAGALPENINTIGVPGSFELVAGAELLANYAQHYDAIICLGCVIQGETKHFDFICHAVSQGLIQLTIKHSRPFIFGVLTTNDHQQALDRSGGKHGNKGIEAAHTAIKMVALART